MSFFSEIFTWWQGNTWGTRFTTWRLGEKVGEDEQGNVYYRSKKGRERRWVIYNGEAEASRIPAAWHGWMHHTVDTPPTEVDYQPRPWELPHEPNLTGTPDAYRPGGSILGEPHRQRTAGDYEPWQPS